MTIKEIKHVRDLVLADMLNGNDKIINGSILKKLDEQLTTTEVVQSQTEKVCEDCKWEHIFNGWYRCGLCDDVQHESTFN